jgi:hypothetical protein
MLRLFCNCNTAEKACQLSGNSGFNAVVTAAAAADGAGTNVSMAGLWQLPLQL